MKKFIAGAATALLVASGLTLSTVSAASATAPPEQCVPSDAWTETVNHPAEGEPTITVDNPDYVPAVEEVSHYVEHPAVTEVVHHPAETKVVKHDAEYRTEYHFAKFVRERTKSADVKGFWQEFSPIYPRTFQGPPAWPTDSRGKWSEKKYSGGPQTGASGVFQNGGNGSWFYRAQAVEGTWGDYGDWFKYSPETHTSWELTTAALGSPQFHSSGTRDGVKWERQWQAQHDGKTRQVKIKDAWEETVVVKEAWDETVVVKEAWREKVIDVEAKPAVGEPTIEVENPDYVPAWTEKIEHDAVVCGPVPGAVIVASCGFADIALANTAHVGAQTASFVVNVDGEFYGAYAVAAGETDSVQVMFPEDSGTHTVEVFQSGLSEWKSLDSVEVETDCERNVPEEPEHRDPTTAVTYSGWSGGDPTCDVQEVEQTRIRTEVTTTYSYVFNRETWEWDEVATEGEPEEFTETRTVVWEGEDCDPTIPPKPEVPKSTIVRTPGEWIGIDPDCFHPTVVQHRLVTIEVTVHDWVWNEETEEWDPTSTSSSFVLPELRKLVYEGEACPLPTPTPTDPTPTPRPTPTHTPDGPVLPMPPNPTPDDTETPVSVPAGGPGKGLAETGGALNPLLPIGGLIVLLTGAGLIARARRTVTD